MRRGDSDAALFVCVVFDRAICYKSAVVFGGKRERAIGEKQ